MLSHAVAIDCGGLSYPVNGQVQISPNSKFGGVAIYQCRFGYELRGTETRVCQSDGRWSSRSPVCRSKIKGICMKYDATLQYLEINCASPPSPNPNGSRRVISTQLFGSTTYMCNRGYFLKGSESVYCRPDGNWSDKAPLCIGKFITVFTKYVVL